LERQACLADAARPNQREQTNCRIDQAAFDLGLFGLPADQHIW
jgi:hypothetical protein